LNKNALSSKLQFNISKSFCNSDKTRPFQPISASLNNIRQ
jgi:hypothetical protein